MSRQGAVVAAGHDETAKAAAEILHAGGNAFDGAIAAVLAACVVEPVLASPGGGGFLMAYEAATGQVRLYDFFAQTPKHRRPEAEIDFRAVHVDFGPATQEFHIGAGATATPGMIPGLFAVHGDLGRLPFSELIGPACDLARDGVTMTEFQAYLFQVVAPILTDTAEASALFASSGALPQAGETFRNPRLAELFTALAKEGPELFVTGDVAQAILRQSRDRGGLLTAADLRDYAVARRQPLQVPYRDHRIFLNPAPSAGGPLIAFALTALAKQLPAGMAPTPQELAETLALTNKARARFPLTDFAMPENILAALEQSADHPSAYRGTTHVSLIDSAGNAAAVTVSNGEGNGILLEDFGFMLNNMLGEEDLHPQGFHRWPPDRRLSSMMAPTLMHRDDGSLTALGSGGSNRIRSAIFQVIVNLVDRSMSPEVAVCAPRLHVEKDGKLSFEARPEMPFFPPEARAELCRRFPDAHEWAEPNMFFGGVHLARRLGDGAVMGMGDPRRSGAVATL